MITIKWSRHSTRIDLTTRSAMEFALGARRGVDSDDAHGAGPFVEVMAVDSVAIVDQIGRCAVNPGPSTQIGPVGLQSRQDRADLKGR